MRTGPPANASITPRWRLAPLAGTNARPSGRRETHRSSTGPAFSQTSSQGWPSPARLTFTVWPGGRNRRSASGSVEAYSRLIHSARRAETSSKAGAASTRSTGAMRAGSSPDDGSSHRPTT
jgi:hypothetical protein